jgi:riboflavin-specific deaminase-like protein
MQPESLPERQIEDSFGVTSRPPAVVSDLDSLYRDLELPAGRGDRPYVVVNMVSTVDGKAVVDGIAGKIGGALDHRVMRHVRGAADAVLNGASTIRAEGFGLKVSVAEEAARAARGLLPRPRHVIVTNSGDLPIEKRSLFRAGSPPPIVATSERARRQHPDRFESLDAVAEVIAVGDSRVDAAQLLRRLVADYGIRRLVLEGGPRLNGELFAAGLVDEVFLTVAARVAGGTGRTIVEGDAPPALDFAALELVSAAPTPTELFLRYRVVPRDRAASL